MPDRPGPVRLFGKEYYWSRAQPGQPLELVPLPPLREPRTLTPAELYEETVRMMGGLLTWPKEPDPT